MYFGLTGEASFVLLMVRMFARREDFAAQLNPLANWGTGHRNVWRIGEDRTDRNDGGPS